MRRNKLYKINKYNANVFQLGGPYTNYLSTRGTAVSPNIGMDFAGAFNKNTANTPGLLGGIDFNAGASYSDIMSTNNSQYYGMKDYSQSFKDNTADIGNQASKGSNFANSAGAWASALTTAIQGAGTISDIEGADRAQIDSDFKSKSAEIDAISRQRVSDSSTDAFLADAAALQQARGANRKDLMRGVNLGRSAAGIIGAHASTGASIGTAIGTVGGPVGNAIGAAIGTVAGAIGGSIHAWLSGEKKKRRAARRALRTQTLADEANRRVVMNAGNTASNVMTNQFENVMANSAAFGGALDYAMDMDAMNARYDRDVMNSTNRIISMPNSFGMSDMQVFATGGNMLGRGLFSKIRARLEANKAAQAVATSPVTAAMEKSVEDASAVTDSGTAEETMFADGGGIHINPKNKGKFTAAAKRAGMDVQEYASHVLANKEDYSPTLVKRANFAHNAAKWRAFGGDLMASGANFDNGLTYINNGGSHESNPYDGVMVGVDPQNTPNLVEEGEVIWNDYVFSNRLKVPKSFREQYKLDKDLDTPMTFAEAAEIFGKEQEERPEDPISNAGLDALLTTLMDKQEQVRTAKAQRDAKRQFNAISPEEQFNIMQMASQNQPAPMMSPMGNPQMPSNMGMPDMEDTMMHPYATEAPMMQGYAYGGPVNKYLTGGDVYKALFSDSPWNDDVVDMALQKHFGNEGFLPAALQPASWGSTPYTYSSPIGKKDKVTRDMLHDDIAREVYDNMVKAGAKDITGEKFTAELYNDPRYIKNTEFLINNPQQAAQWLIANGDAKTKKDVQKYLDTNDIGGLKSFIRDKREDYLYGDFHHTFSTTSPIDQNWVIGEDSNPVLLSDTTGYERVLADPYQTNLEGTNYNNYFWRKVATEPEKAPSADVTPQNVINPVQKEEEKKGIDIPYEPKQTWSRYAPVVGAGVGILTDALGITNTPDESSADAILKAAENAGTPDLIDYQPVGNYLRYDPFDLSFATNKLSAEAGATRRAIQQQATGNAGSAMAGLLAADYNAQGRLGDLFRQAEEYNLGQRQKVEEFNRGTNMFNAQQYLTAAQANQAAMQRARQISLSGIAQAEGLRQAARQQSANARSANLTNFLQGLGNIGAENEQMNWQRALYSSGFYGPENETLNRILGYDKGNKRNKKKGGK